MKTYTTYPTKHPHWIDETEVSTSTKFRKRTGISFGMAVAIVVAIHVAVIAGVYFHTSPKPKVEVAKTLAQNASTTPLGPKSDALDRNEWPQPDAKPKVVATPPPAPKREIVSKPAANPKPPVGENKPVVKAPAQTPENKSIVKAVVQAPKKQNPPDSIGKDDAAAKKAFLAARAGQSAPETTVVTPSATVALQAKRTPELAKIAVPSPEQIAATPAKIAEPQAVRNPPMRVTEYTLSAGDNLYLVSRKLGVSYNDLARANGISDPRQLRVGQTLKVPGVASL